MLFERKLLILLSIIDRDTSKIVEYVFADFFLLGLYESEALESYEQTRTFWDKMG